MVSSPLARTPSEPIVRHQGGFVDLRGGLGDRGEEAADRGVRDCREATWDAVDACRRMDPPPGVLFCSAASSSDWTFFRVCRALADDEAALSVAVDCLPGAVEVREREGGDEGGEDGREGGMVDTAEGLAGDACSDGAARRWVVDALLDCTEATEGPRNEMPRAGLFGRAAEPASAAAPANDWAASSGRNFRSAPSKSSWSSWSDTLGVASHNAWTRWRVCSNFSWGKVPSISNFSSFILPSLPSSPVFTGGKELASPEPPT